MSYCYCIDALCQNEKKNLQQALNLAKKEVICYEKRVDKLHDEISELQEKLDNQQKISNTERINELKNEKLVDKIEELKIKEEQLKKEIEKLKEKNAANLGLIHKLTDKFAKILEIVKSVPSGYEQRIAVAFYEIFKLTCESE